MPKLHVRSSSSTRTTSKTSGSSNTSSNSSLNTIHGGQTDVSAKMLLASSIGLGGLYGITHTLAPVVKGVANVAKDGMGLIRKITGNKSFGTKNEAGQSGTVSGAATSYKQDKATKDLRTLLDVTRKGFKDVLKAINGKSTDEAKKPSKFWDNFKTKLGNIGRGIAQWAIKHLLPTLLKGLAGIAGWNFIRNTFGINKGSHPLLYDAYHNATSGYAGIRALGQKGFLKPRVQNWFGYNKLKNRYDRLGNKITRAKAGITAAHDEYSIGKGILREGKREKDLIKQEAGLLRKGRAAKNLRNLKKIKSAARWTKAGVKAAMLGAGAASSIATFGIGMAVSEALWYGVVEPLGDGLIRRFFSDEVKTLRKIGLDDIKSGKFDRNSEIYKNFEHQSLMARGIGHIVDLFTGKNDQALLNAMSEKKHEDFRNDVITRSAEIKNMGGPTGKNITAADALLMGKAGGSWKDRRTYVNSEVGRNTNKNLAAALELIRTKETYRKLTANNNNAPSFDQLTPDQQHAVWEFVKATTDEAKREKFGTLLERLPKDSIKNLTPVKMYNIAESGISWFGGSDHIAEATGVTTEAGKKAISQSLGGALSITGNKQRRQLIKYGKQFKNFAEVQALGTQFNNTVETAYPDQENKEQAKASADEIDEMLNSSIGANTASLNNLYQAISNLAAQSLVNPVTQQAYNIPQASQPQANMNFTPLYGANQI